MPVRVEIGPHDLAPKSVSVFRRDRRPKERASHAIEAFVAGAAGLLEEIQTGLLERARAYREANTKRLTSLAEVTEFFAEPAKAGGCTADLRWCMSRTIRLWPPPSIP
jgi:prolyl-tRNA synthetase